jgi:PAS domain S-box-containing protein
MPFYSSVTARWSPQGTGAQRERAPWFSYSIAVMAVLVAGSATALFHRVAPEKSLSLVFFFAAVAVSAGLGGLGPGVLATLLSALICDYFFLLPLHSLAIASSDLPLLVLFVLVALLINGLSGQLHAGTRAADQRFHDLVQGLEAIVWEGNPLTLQFAFVSQRAEDILGYPVAQWLADPEFRAHITHPEDCVQVLKIVRETSVHSGDSTFEYRVRAADGREVWLRETVHVVCNERGQPVRLSGLCVDISERKRAAEELSARKDELATLNSITAAVSTSLELSAVLAALKAQLTEQLAIPGGCILLVNEADDRLTLQESWGTPALSMQDTGKEPAGMLTAWTEAQDDGSAYQVVAQATPPPFLSGVPLPAGWQYLSVPLQANGRLQGVLYLFSPASPGFSTHRLAYFETLGRQVGVILQNARLFAQVHAGRERLQQLSRQLVHIQEAERREIARELHDEVGQALTGLKLSLEMSTRLSAEEAQQILQRALDQIDELMVHVRDLSLDLRPAMLDVLGLVPTLLWHFERYSLATGVQVDFQHTELEPRFAPELETAAYRIIQEALTNVARHAGVTAVRVHIWTTRDFLEIEVVDAGRGFQVEETLAQAKTAGLAGMEERAMFLGGHLSIESTPGTGTRLMAALPRYVARMAKG